METDSPEVLNEAIRSVKKFGRISIIADYAAYTNGLLIGGIMEKGISLVGAGQCPAQKYADEVLGKIASGEFDPTTILTHRFTLEDLPEVYAAFDEKRDGMMKVFIEVRPFVLLLRSISRLTWLDRRLNSPLPPLLELLLSPPYPRRSKFCPLFLNRSHLCVW